jgi:hypothetical protein
MPRRGWFFKPPVWLLGTSGMLGAIAYIVFTFLSTPFINASEQQTNYDMLGKVLIFAVLTLVLPLTRGFGLGFFAAMLLGSANSVFGARQWWVPVEARIDQAIRPSRERRLHKDSTAAWFARHRGKELDVYDAAWLLSRVREDCLQGPVATNVDDLLSNPRCAIHRTTVQREKLEYPSRYGPGDNGWRWSYERLSDSSASDGPNYHIVLRPDSALEQSGPIVEERADGLARIRKDERSDWHVVSTPIPLMRRVRECVLLAAAMADAEQNTTVVDDYLYYGYYAVRVCRDITMSSSTTTETGDHVVDIKRHPPPNKREFPEGVLFRPVGKRRFEIRRQTVTRHYLLDADGGLHVTSEKRQAETTDPAPARCEEDTSLPCSDR